MASRSWTPRDARFVADPLRRLVAEALGSALLLATVVGSGIMAERLAGGSVGLALLANAVATGAMLPVLIMLLGPISGAHLNPAVTLVFWMRGEIRPPLALGYAAAQAVGAVAGVALAHAMFGLALLSPGVTARAGAGQWIAEAVATATLVIVILGVRRARPEAVPMAVGLTITAAYWFTASTSFANPAVTLARGLTPSFAGILPADVFAFVAVQLIAAPLAALGWAWLSQERGAARSA
jgi:glycerol uptake facilitator-like aquaporin